MGVQERLAHRIRRAGPIPFDEFVDAALYDPDDGFFARGRGAGRAGSDFLTSPEVGPLFGALVGRALDGWWRDLVRPDPFVVVEAGAGSGRLAREVLRGEPECLPALRYVLVERSATLRAAQRDLLVVEPAGEALGPFAAPLGGDQPAPVARAGPVITALDDLPALEFEGVVVANELLDNLPFGIARWSGGHWEEVRVGLDDDDRFVELSVPAGEGDAAALAALTRGLDPQPGTRLPLPRGIETWLAAVGAVLRTGYLLLIDYVDTVAGVMNRGPDAWLRTYRGHRRGGSPFEQVGEQDVTADVVAEQLSRAAAKAGFSVERECSQAEWLASLGLDELVEEGRQRWVARSDPADLAALTGRSRIAEATALTDPAGLGGHRVQVFVRGVRG